MGEYEDLPYIVIERRSGGISPFLWGALLGAGVALLLAPRSGEETQEELRQGVRRLRTAAEDRVGTARETVSDAVNRTRDRLQDQLDTVRTTVESRGVQARQAIDAGRRAARDARSELERRVAEAKDSYAAAADAVRQSGGSQAPPAPDADLIVTEVVEERIDVVVEPESRPDLG